MLRNFLTAALLLGATTVAIAQDSATAETSSPLGISGFVDVYFRYDFAKTKANNFTSFTNSHNSFELGMASLKLDHSFGKVAVVADLGFGKRAQEFSYNETDIVASIKQLYVSYSVSEWLKFTAGSWATHVGYELVDAPANRSYSMSYMFSYGPFSHTGLKADLTFGKHGFMVGVSNPTDYKSAPLDSKKYLLAQYSLAATDNLKFYLNYVGGERPSDSAQTNQIDLVATAQLSDKFSVGLNGSYFTSKLPEKTRSFSIDKEATSAWWGSALYLSYDPSAKFGLTLRSELFNDADQSNVFASADAGGKIFANTLSGNFRLGPLVIIPEFRIENASQRIYVDENGKPTKSAASALVAAVYTF
jgi:hypothetical protein